MPVEVSVANVFGKVDKKGRAHEQYLESVAVYWWLGTFVGKTL